MIATLVAVLPGASGLGSTVALLVLAGSLSLLVSLIFAVRVMFPQVQAQRDSLLFFGTVASKTFSDYNAAILSRSPDGYLQDLNAQCHTNSQIASNKFHNVSRALQWFLIGLAPWLAALYLLVRG